LNDLEKRVLDAIDHDGLLDYLCELISIRSLTGEEGEAQRNVSEKMADIGLEVDSWVLDLESLRGHPDFSMEVDREEGMGVVGVYGEDRGGRSLILNGHVDVVPPGDESNWSYPPWKAIIDSGRVYGRGAVDMKGGLSCALFAVKAIRDAGVQLDGKLIVESVVGEEDGGVGTLASVLRGYTADGGVIMEPTELKIAPAQAGALCFRIKVHGQSAHACVREEGVSAIEKFMPIYAALTKLEKYRNLEVDDPLYSRYSLPIPLNLGKIQAGNWPSTVPESLVLEGRYGIGVGEDIEEARRVFEKTLSETVEADPWLREHRPDMEWWGGQFKPASIPVDDPIALTVDEAYRAITGSKAVYEGVTYGSDMRHLVNVGGTPTVLFGPGDVRTSHRPDEYVSIEDLRTTVNTLALTVLRFCGAR